MIKWLICKIWGHKKYSPHALNGNPFIALNDSMGSPLVFIHICKRCKKLYVEFQ